MNAESAHRTCGEASVLPCGQDQIGRMIMNTRDQVRDTYAAAARAITARCGGSEGGHADCCGGDCCGGGDCCSGPAATTTSGFGADRYPPEELTALPPGARQASLGCGNPIAVADLQPGETVLDLGSGGGGDVLLSARRVGPTGTAFGLDMTDEMLDLARANAAEAGAGNVVFLKGTIEQIPLPAGSVDVVISNCVINLSTDKPAVFTEMFRVLRPGGRVGITDVVASDALSPAERAERGDWTSCLAGALSRREYVEGLSAVGFTQIDIIDSHGVADGMVSAIIKAVAA
jgi:arsenite methyltransferase